MKHKTTLLTRWDVFREQKSILEKHQKARQKKSAMAKILLTYTKTFNVYKCLFDKVMDLKNERFREFAEKYYGGILKKKMRNHLSQYGSSV